MKLRIYCIDGDWKFPAACYERHNPVIDK